MIVNCINNEQVNNPIELLMNAQIAKHIEYTQIYLKFNENLQFVHLTDNIIIKLLDDIDNRL